MPTQLAFSDRFRKKLGTPITSDTSNSIAFASLPSDIPTKLVASWTGEQFKKLLSSVMAGADLLWGDESDEIIWQLIKVVHQPITLEDEEDNCINYPPSAPFVSFIPQNPYNTPELVPDGYIQPPFLVNTGFQYPELFGYLETDVMVSPDSLPLLGGWDDLISLNFPTIKLTVRGVGQIELDLLSATVGGYAIIKVGSPPNILDLIDGVIETGVVIVDLNQDALALPIESDLIISEEVDIDAPDGTDVYIVFVPKIDDSISFYGFGGGIRQIGLCGLEEMGVIMGIEDIRFNAETCQLEQRELGIWTVVENWDEIWNCIGGLMATQGEIKQAIIDAAEQLAAQMLAGETTNMIADFTYSKSTGEKTFGVIGVDDNPDTLIDEKASARFGGVSEIAAKLEAFIDMVDTCYGATNGTPVDFEATCQEKIAAYWPVDRAAMDAAITAYYAYRTSQPRILFDRGTAFPLYLYCNGYNDNVLGRWLLDVSGYAFPKQVVVLDLWKALSDEFFSDFYEIGVSKPSSAYLDAACVPMPYQEYFNIPYGSSRTLSPNPSKGGHRLIIEVSGYYVDPDGDIQDAFWYRSNAGALTKSDFTFVQGAGSNMPSANQVPYSATHTYQYTIDLSSGNNSWSVQFNRHASMNVASTSPTNGFSIKITDVGLAVS